MKRLRIVLLVVCVGLMATSINAQPTKWYGTPPTEAQTAYTQALVVLSTLGISQPPLISEMAYRRSGWYDVLGRTTTSKPGKITVDNPCTVELCYDNIETSVPGGGTDPLLLAFIIYHEYQHANGTVPLDDVCADLAAYGNHLAQICTWLDVLKVEFPQYSTDELCEYYETMAALYNATAVDRGLKANCTNTGDYPTLDATCDGC